MWLALGHLKTCLCTYLPAQAFMCVRAHVCACAWSRRVRMHAYNDLRELLYVSTELTKRRHCVLSALIISVQGRHHQLDWLSNMNHNIVGSKIWKKQESQQRPVSTASFAKIWRLNERQHVWLASKAPRPLPQYDSNRCLSYSRKLQESASTWLKFASCICEISIKLR